MGGRKARRLEGWKAKRLEEWRAGNTVSYRITGLSTQALPPHWLLWMAGIGSNTVLALSGDWETMSV